MFRVVETLYGVRIARAQAPDLAPGRALLRIARRRAASRVGQFYLDLYARERKRGGAWMDEAIDAPPHGAARADAGRVPHLQLLRGRSAASPRSSRTTK